MPRPRIDLDGVPLTDPANPYMTLAIFRFRTKEGLVLLIPESAEILIGWEKLEKAGIDLAKGRIELVFVAGYVPTQSWLRGAHTLIGEWLDRHVKQASELGLT